MIVMIAEGHYFHSDLIVGVFPCGCGGTHVVIHGIGILHVDDNPYDVSARMGWVPTVPVHIDLGEGRDDIV